MEKLRCIMPSQEEMSEWETGRCYGGQKRSPIRKGYFEGAEELIAVDLPGHIPCHPLHQRRVLPAVM